jgi:hypothetical protein
MNETAAPVDYLREVLELANDATGAGDVLRAFDGEQASLLGQVIANELETGIDLDLCEDLEDAKCAGYNAIQSLIDCLQEVQNALSEGGE